MLKNLVVAGFLRLAYTIGALFEFKKSTGIKIWKGAIQKIGYLTLSLLKIFVLIKMLLKNVSQLHSCQQNITHAETLMLTGFITLI
jgi:hypothetical protein